MNEEVNWIEEAKIAYDLLWEVCRDETAELLTAYRRLRDLLERLCRLQTTDSSLQMTDLSARISFVASKLGLTVAEQNRLHTFRITSNALLNHRGEEVSRTQLLRDVKTLAFLVKRMCSEEVPVELHRLLPVADATYRVAPPARKRVRRLRVCFQYADDDYLYVQPVDEVVDAWWKVRYNVPEINEEFAETCKLLWRYAQLNLLDVAFDEAGILTPSFIILEPDYLIDISSLAECFKEYGHHPANYYLSRLQLPENTGALLLGNIANLFLDEWIHAKEAPSYRECMQKAFQCYPIELTTCAELADPNKEKTFFANTALHFENIRSTVTETFKEAGYDLDKHDAVLEPSYICEALGLQGRLDYMQRDMSAFIEMKSGKADEYSLPGKVQPKENNKVQMLLYQAVLEYSMGMDHRHVKSYLLYTRYPLLYPARPSWAMVRRVMDVRNRIVANEYGIQLRNSPYYTAEKLKEISSSVLNERGLNTMFWNRYLAPSIDALRVRMDALTPLEQSYFYSLYNFITKELYTSKSGDVDYEGRTGASALWLSTLEEKCEAGEILYNLTIVENKAAEEHRPYLVLARTADSEIVQSLPNFRQGDAVVLYERNEETDNVTNKLVFKGNIEYLYEDRLCVRLRSSQQNVAVLPPNSCYAVEHDATMDTSFRSMYLGLSAFLAATQRRRDLLLAVREPEYDAAYVEAARKATDDFQRVTLKACAARDYFLLVGPPGTGKTSRALRSMVETFYREGKQILLLSYTNRAVDEICKALTSITPAVDFIRIGNELTCEEAYRPYLAEHVLTDCLSRRAVRQKLCDCRIFVGTVATLSTKTDLFSLKTFDVAIVDEATQILEPQLLGLLCARNAAGADAIGKFVLIGDHKQLPAVVLQSSQQSEVCVDELNNIGLCNLKDSLFERLYRRLYRAARIDGADEAKSVDSPYFDMLCRQGRMNVEVALFPNQAFYDGLLQPVGLPHQAGDLQLSPCMEQHRLASLLTRRVAFLPSEPQPMGQPVKVNHSEAVIVAQLAEAVYHQYKAAGDFDSLRTLGIITPYRSQIALIKSEIAKLGIDALNRILVDTVERFQGSERDVIVYSFCVNRTYQLKYLANLSEEAGVMIDRKLNVALTRARKQLFMTGVPALLKQNVIYAQLLERVV